MMTINRICANKVIIPPFFGSEHLLASRFGSSNIGRVPSRASLLLFNWGLFGV